MLQNFIAAAVTFLICALTIWFYCWYDLVTCALDHCSFCQASASWRAICYLSFSVSLSVRPSVRPSVYLLNYVLHLNECTYRQTFRPSVGHHSTVERHRRYKIPSVTPSAKRYRNGKCFCNLQRKLGLSRKRYEIGITNRKSQVADRSMSALMILSDLERREAKGPFFDRSYTRFCCLT